MYIERKEKFSFKSFFLIILIILLFIFLIIWLIPKKNDSRKLQSEVDLIEIKNEHDTVFANNLRKMKNSAINYLVPKKLPKNVDESVTLSLSQMYNLNIISTIKDKNKKTCDKDESYVEILKTFSNYKLTVNLKCNDEEDYIVVYLNNYSYCKNKNVCEKKASSDIPSTKEIKVKEEERKKDTDKKSEEKDKVVETSDLSKDNNVIMYEYSKLVNSATKCSDWSEWSREKIEPTLNLKVETKDVNEVIDYTYEKQQVGTNKETVIKQVKEKYISGYSTRLVESGTEPLEVGKKYNKSNGTYEPVYKTIKVYKEERVPIYDYKVVDKEEVIDVPVYDEVKKEVYGMVTYYRFQECNDKYDLKYSYVNDDVDLLSKGYKLTGNTKEG